MSLIMKCEDVRGFVYILKSNKIIFKCCKRRLCIFSKKMYSYDQVKNAYNKHAGDWASMARELVNAEELGLEVMPFGKHRNVAFKNIPPGYFQWFLTLPETNPELRAKMMQYMESAYPNMVTEEAMMLKKFRMQEWEEKKQAEAAPTPVNSPSYAYAQEGGQDSDSKLTFPTYWG